MSYQVVIDAFSDGTYRAVCLNIPGCVADGFSREEVYANVITLMRENLDRAPGFIPAPDPTKQSRR